MYATGNELATDKQIAYLEALRDGKDLSQLSAEQRAWLADADFKVIAKQRASDVIAKLKEQPWAAKDDKSKLPEVKDGRYAIPGTDGTLKFYSVKNGEHKIFVNVWASDARWPVKGAARLPILEAIAADPEAGPRFGKEIGACYVCGRTLTDDTSRSLGIGPVCRGDQ
jgi:hypothetical protein